MPLDLNEPEEWNGPDPFGEYSPAMESSMNPRTSRYPTSQRLDAADPATETNGNAR